MDPGAGTDRGAGEDPGSRERAERWLDERLDDAPERLGELVRDLLRRADPEEAPEDVADWLAWAAYQEFLAVDGSDREGDAAFRLLAADAALTYAFEAAADTGSDLEGLARRWGPAGRLGRELAARLEAKRSSQRAEPDE